jgi:UDP-N-acetylmuramyl tripeptide synthase
MQLSEPLMYIGPNRRSEKTVIEWPLQMTGDELKAVSGAAADGWRKHEALLAVLGIDAAPGDECGLRESEYEKDALILRTGRRMCVLALKLQQAAGHRVDFNTVLPESDPGRCRLIFEYEHLGTGLDAGELALHLFSMSVAGLHWQAEKISPDADAQSLFREFRARAEKFVLPLDAQAIIDAAARLDIPCVKLERDPYGGLSGQFRIRKNGLLKLGHSCHRQIVDGTLCLDRNAELTQLLFDREALFQCMSKLKLPVPRQDLEFRNLISVKRVLRAAGKIGYPVVLKPMKRSRGRKTSGTQAVMPLESAAALQKAFEQMRAKSPQVIVEQFVSGRTFRLLMVSQEPLCVVADDGRNLAPTVLHDSTLRMAKTVSQTLGSGLLRVSLVCPDPGAPLTETGGAVIDLDPAPKLDLLFSGDTALMADAAEHFVRWLYPPGTPSRIPLVAITGTNGKTTTTKMISRIARKAGFVPGMASTSGFYINDVLQEEGDLAGTDGHHLLFESSEVNLGVLETARGAVLHSGFMFDWCDVAVCLNVTEDHIGEYGIDTLEKMVHVKRSILARARRAVVLNADYQTCRDMLPFAEGVHLYWTSVKLCASEVGELLGGKHFTCVLERQGDKAVIALYDPGGARLVAVPVSEIPATIDGAALFNVSNAQHALCASHALGLRPGAIQHGLSTFTAGMEDNPGRLNIYRELPFTVIMDYVHNKDGMQKLCEFTDQMDIPGRRILLYSTTGNRTDEEVANYARSAIGHFDHYFCRSYPDLRGRRHGEIPALMKDALLDAGVPDDHITIVPEREDGTRQTLGAARPGDLVVLAVATEEEAEMWAQILSFEPELSG